MNKLKDIQKPVVSGGFDFKGLLASKEPCSEDEDEDYSGEFEEDTEFIDEKATSPQTNDHHDNQHNHRNTVTLLTIEKLVDEFVMREAHKLIHETQDQKVMSFNDSRKLKAELAELEELEDLERNGT